MCFKSSAAFISLRLRMSLIGVIGDVVSLSCGAESGVSVFGVDEILKFFAGVDFSGEEAVRRSAAAARISSKSILNT